MLVSADSDLCAEDVTRLCRQYGARAGDWGFVHLAVPRLISIIDPGNAASIRVAQKNGMTVDGDAEYDGKTCLVYAVGRVVWEKMGRRRA